MKTIAQQVKWALVGIPLVVMLALVWVQDTPTAGAVGGTAPILASADFLFDPNVIDPDPAVWAAAGTITPRAVLGRGLQLVDLGATNSLLYCHGAPEIGGPNAATLSAVVRTPAVSDASTAAWSSNDITGSRLILDDGQRRLELAFGRNPADTATPKQRVLVVLGAAGTPLSPFPWDNGFHNAYQIDRLSNGDFVITATNSDPANTAPPVTLTVAAAQLPAPSGAAMACWGTGAEGGGISEWQEVHAVVTAGGDDDFDDDGERNDMDDDDDNDGMEDAGDDDDDNDGLRDDRDRDDDNDGLIDGDD